MANFLANTESLWVSLHWHPQGTSDLELLYSVLANGPKITTQSFKLPKQYFKTKLQGLKNSGQKGSSPLRASVSCPLHYIFPH